MLPATDPLVQPAASSDPFAEAERLYQAAREYEAHPDRGRHVEALKVFLAFVEARRRELSPKGPELAHRLDEAAMSLYRQSQADLAGRSVELGLGFRPDSPTLLHHKALILLTQNRNLDYVLPLLDRALQANPHDRSIWATKGDALRVMNRTEAAIEAYLQAQQLDASSTQFVDRALKLDPHHAGALRVKLKLARQQGGERQALDAVDALLREVPDDLELRLTKADLLVGLGLLEEAGETIDRLRGETPEDPRTPVVHARLLFALGRTEEAYAEIRRFLQGKAVPDATLLGELAERITRARGDLALALELRGRAREVDPRNLANLKALRALAMEVGQTDLALDAAKAVLAVAPDNLEAMRALAELFLGAGRPDEAFAVYGEVAKAHPREVGELRKAMVAAQSAARPELVLAFSAAVLQEAPEDLPARELHAKALSSSGRKPEALAAYEELIARRPGEVRFLLERKQLLVDLGRTDALPAAYDELFQLDPTRTDIALERGNLYLARAYAEPDGSAGRADAARTALVSYERANRSSERRSSALLGLARAARVVHMLERAIPAYTEFLAVPGNDRRADAHKELGHLYRESHRFREAESEYAHALELGLEDVDLLWGEAETLVQLGQEASALRYLDLLLLNDAANPLYLRRKGQILLKIGRRAEAVGALSAAVQAAGGDPAIQFEIAGALRAQGAHADAVGYYREGLRTDPENRGGRLALAESLLAGDQAEASIAEVDRLLHEDPNDIGAWRVRADAFRRLGRTPDLLYSLRAILLLDPHHAAALREKSELHLAAGQKSEAFDALQQLTQGGGAEAADPRLWLQVADIAAELGQTEEANRSYERALELDPQLKYDVAERRARLRLAAGRPDLALELLDAGAAGDAATLPVSTQLLRAEVLGALERPADAQAVYEKVREREPTNGAALAGVGRALLDQGKAKEAEELLRGGMAQVTAPAALYLLLAEAEGALGALPEAVRVLTQGTRAVPESVPLWGRLAEVFVRQENWPEAADALAHAMALDPKSAELPLRAGFVAERLGHGHEALALYEHATELQPSDKNAWTSRGLALLTLGRADEAVPSFERALGLDSDFEAAKEGKRAALQKTRETLVERYGREALLLESRLGRPVTRNDLFVTLHLPFDLLEPVLGALARTPKVDLPRLTEAELRDLESASCALVVQALERRPEGIERRGLTLADVATLAPASYSLGDLQRLFAYVRAVLELELRAQNLTLTPEVEELARRALTLPEAQRTLFELVRTLRVGLYKARIIKAIEEAGGAVHAPLPSVDLAPYTPEFAPGAAERAAAADAGAGGSHEAAPASEFFPADDEAAFAPPIVPVATEPDRPARMAADPASEAGSRCIGCGGIASVHHACGADLCQHCIAQYRTCPKCGLVVAPSSARAPPSGGGGHRAHVSRPAPSAPVHSAPAPAPKGGLRAFLTRTKASPGPAPARTTSPPRGAEPAPARGAPRPVPPPPSPPRALTGKAAKPVPSPPPAPAEVEPPPPPPPRPREKRDDEPRL